MDFVGLSADRRADRILVNYVTDNYFSMLGVPPALGRVFQPSGTPHPGDDPSVVLGNTYWRKRFGADPSVVGRTVLINGKPFTVAGVVPASFLGAYALTEAEAYLPFTMHTPADYERLVTKRDEHTLHVLGRLRPGLTRAQAQAAIDVTAAQLEAQFPTTNKGVRARVIPEWLARPEANAADQNPIVAGVFLVLVGLVLLVACVNVVNLIMVRATARHRELAVRAALGAGRGRLIRQLLTESLVLAALGGAAGALIGWATAGLLQRIQFPMDIPIRMDFAFDWRVFGYVALLALSAGIGVGLLPALRSSRSDLNAALREGGRGTSEGGSRQRVRSVLVVAQVAVSLVLLIAAGLFVRSVMRAQSIDLGFDPSHVLNAAMDVSAQGYDEPRGRQFFDELLLRAKRLPGVESASLAYSVPMGYYNTSTFIEIEGQPASDKQRRPAGGLNFVSPEYLATMKLRLVSGRFILPRDDERAPRVAVINQFMARRFWPGQDPIGRRFRASDAGDAWLEVIGVVQDAHQSWLFDDPQPYVYVALAQVYRPLRTLQLRVTGDAAALAPLVQREIRALDPNLPMFDVRTMTAVIQGPNGFFFIRLGAIFGGVPGLLGLTLALVGVYGVVSYTASQRTQEIGVRMALGAARRDILRLVLGRGLVLIGAGVAAGTIVSVGLSRLMASLLFNLSPVDPPTFIGVPVLLGLMALVASYVPALRATRVDPAIALRGE
jgi:putative ABC transport system permease protein